MTARPRRLLFICSRNQWRSPTAETVLNEVNDVEAISAGTNNDAETPLSGDLIIWADEIHVMEREHRKKVTQKFRSLLSEKPVRVLGIPDKYTFMDAALVALIRRKFPEYFTGN